jgi:alpha-N-arabinofuranosidase
MDSHNTFDHPDTVKPVAYSGRMVGGKLVFDLPAKGIAVVAIN